MVLVFYVQDLPALANEGGAGGLRISDELRRRMGGNRSGTGLRPSSSPKPTTRGKLNSGSNTSLGMGV